MANITCLPNEIIFSILEQEDISIKDVINFSLTCKKLHMAIKDNNVLWKRKLFQRWPALQEVYTLNRRDVLPEYLVLDMKTFFHANRFEKVKLYEDKEMLKRHKLYRRAVKEFLLKFTSISPLFEFIYDINQLYFKTTNYKICSDATIQLVNIYYCPERNSMRSRLLIRRCVDFLKHHDDRVQILGLLLIVRITICTSKHTKAIVSYGAIPPLVSLLKASRMDARLALWILSNIIEEVPRSCDVILSHNAVPLLLDLIKSIDSVCELRDIVWMLVRLWQNKDPPPPLNIIKSVLPALDRQLTIA